MLFICYTTLYLITLVTAQISYICPKYGFLNFKVDVDFGTPPQRLALALDSTDAYSYVQSSTCIVNCSNIVTFDSSKSSSSLLADVEKIPDRIILLGNDLSGPIGSDTIGLNGLQFKGFEFQQVNNFIGRNGVSGSLGLGLSIRPGNKNFLQLTVSSGKIAKMMYGYSIDESGNFSILDLGYFNNSLFTNQLQFVKLTNIPLTRLVDVVNATRNDTVLTPFGINIESISLGTNVIPIPKQIAFIHTDLTVSRFPVTLMNTIAEKLGAKRVNNLYEIKCDVTRQLPNITIDFNGFKATFNSKEYMFKHVNNAGCFLAFTSYDQPLFKDSLILGLGLLRKYYLAFDHAQQQIGFANAVTSTKTEVVVTSTPASNNQLPSHILHILPFISSLLLFLIF
ncbi:aspartic peptidase domain-containing protein [Globomyces pollinis-pini]|nr:aspartic peptidase domain-containing protein [Globomyces pollinis-pini]